MRVFLQVDVYISQVTVDHGIFGPEAQPVMSLA